MSQECRQAIEFEKKKEMESSLEPLEKNTVGPHFDFSTMRPL